jgi:hypothetical protein
MPLFNLILISCSLGVSNRVSLEEQYKGCRHKLARLVQESLQDSESGMEIDSFV